MNRTAFLLLALSVCHAQAATDPRRKLAEGTRAFDAGNFTNAATAFAAAAEQAAAARLDPAIAHYNRGLALLKNGEFGPAAEQLQTASRTTDLIAQQQSLFARGNALHEAARGLEQQQQLQPALSAMTEAQTMFEKALALRPHDTDAKVNYELASREAKRLEELVRRQQQNQQQQDQQKQDQKQDQQQKQQQGPPDQQPQEDQAAQDKPKPENKDGPSQKNQQAPEKPSAGDDAQPPNTNSGREMTPEEASRLLDAMKEQEQSAREQIARDRLRSNAGKLTPVEKDW